MDELANFNRARWNALVEADVMYAQPWLDMTPDTARALVDPQGVMGDVRDQAVLLLAGGGGQQSAAFALLGARVTVLELSDAQLERDRAALAHYGFSAALHQGDMRDLSRYAPASFDVVWQPYSINFVPDVGAVFDQVARVIRPGGLYHLAWHNPFIKGIEDRDWTPGGYLLRKPYRDGEMQFDDDHWEFEGADGDSVRLPGPREFNHTLSTVLNSLIARKFAILGLWEDFNRADPSAALGTWEHFTAVAPPYFDLWARRAG